MVHWPNEIEMWNCLVLYIDVNVVQLFGLGSLQAVTALMLRAPQLLVEMAPKKGEKMLRRAQRY